ncbi:MAG: hypothetical protein IPN15_16910 [Saprospiraceae bacterium]|nr:hypothetical protein [Candidatus Vicinibacter affinis]
MKCATLTCAGSSVVIPQRYLNDCDANETQSACYTGLAIARCDWVPTDVTDTAEIEAAVLAGKIKLLPKGKLFWKLLLMLLRKITQDVSTVS